MTERHLTENCKVETSCSARSKKNKRFLQVSTLVALFFFWIGYAFALYRGNDSKISSYSLLIVAFSLVNFNTLCGVEKIENRAVNFLANLNGVLFFGWAFITVVSIILK